MPGPLLGCRAFSRLPGICRESPEMTDALKPERSFQGLILTLHRFWAEQREDQALERACLLYTSDAADEL